MRDTEIDEDTFVLPSAWLRQRTPRRGSERITPFVPDPEARTLTQRIVADPSRGIKGLLEASTTPEPVRAAALAWRRRDPAAPPLGAAVIAALKAAGQQGHVDDMIKHADLWIAERGLTFAAVAAVELLSLVVLDDTAPPHHRFWSTHARGVRHLRPGEASPPGGADTPLQILLRVRAALAAAPGDEFDRAVAALEPFRGGHPETRVACSVLVPRADWVAADVADALADDDSGRIGMLMYATGTSEQAEALAPHSDLWRFMRRPGMVFTLIDGLGAGAAPAMFRWIDRDLGDLLGVANERWLLSVLATLPGDHVIRGLVERVTARNVRPALFEAISRFPARGIRILAEEAGTPAVDELLRTHVLGHLDLVDRVVPALSPAAVARVEAIVSTATSVPVAPLSAVPHVLVQPPWQNRVKVAKPAVVPGLTCPDPASVSWRPGEREQWTRLRAAYLEDDAGHWARIAGKIAADKAPWYEARLFFVQAPEELARPLLATWQVRHIWDADVMRIVAARFDAAALPAVLASAREFPADQSPILLPFSSPELAVQMADWLARLKSLRKTALAWLLRHPAEAARALVPPALGKAGTGRRQAERALLTLHGNGHTGHVRAAADSYGPEAAAAIEALLSTDPLQVLPPRMPATPVWAAPGLLPPVRLRDGSGALPAETAVHLVTMLMISKPGEPYAGVDLVRAAVDPADLAEFGWALFQMWQSAGAPAKENWVLDALGLTGDDETVRRLAPLILAWPGEGGHARAVAGVGVLAGIGTGVALMHLHRIAQRAKFKGLKTAAATRMDEVADSLGLSTEQLADRLVPDLGLDADGSLRLDYGPRRFTVGFDEQLRPFVVDEQGRRLKALPRPGARDDADLAPAAYRRFTALKKDVRTIAADQVRRLEQAMVTGRRWTGAEFRELFAGHPLLWHIVRRLVWGRFDTSGALTGTLRIAEDRSLATVADEPTTLAGDEIVGIVHPLQLGAEEAGGWARVFADYEILQPFPQLGRARFTLTADETAGPRLARFEGLRVPTTKLLGLERRGWRRESPQDGGIQSVFEKQVGSGLTMMVQMDPGIAVGELAYFPDQKLESVFLHNGTGTWWFDNKGEVPLKDLDPVALSEIVRDLTEVTA